MKLKENVLANFGHQIDLMNTLNGGITFTDVQVFQSEDGYLVKVHNPAFDDKNYHIEINGGNLVVYATLNNLSQEANTAAVVPAFIRFFPIPPNIAMEEIEATFKDNLLQISAPFRDGFDNSTKKIDIRVLN